jgi:Ca-activated chloride channel family protein
MEALSDFNWTNFHFLRPWGLWGVLITLLITAFVLLTNREQSKWKNIIAESLRPYMFSKGNPRAAWIPTIAFLIAGVLTSISLAGPTWKRVEVPGMKSTATLMILLDMSWSMMAEDIQPNRLERAKLKISDLLAANPGAGTSLFVYAGTVHPVIPSTSDYELIDYNVEHLRCVMMPVFGDNLPLAMNLVDSLFDRQVAPSTLLLITDEVKSASLNPLLNFVDNSVHRIELLQVSTPSGAEVPGFRPNTIMKNEEGNVVRSLQDRQVITQLSKHPRINVNPFTLDNSDVELIASGIRKNLEFQSEDDESAEEWEDEGLLVLLPAMLLALLFFRKGWVIQWCMVPVLFSIGGCSPESKYADWWYSSDYQGQLLDEEHKYGKAADAYESIQHKAIAYYNSGDYEAAAALFEQDTSASGFYNLGLALANQGDYDGAIIALEKARELNGESDNSTLTNALRLVQDQRTASDSINRFDPEVLKEVIDDSPLNERTAKGKDEELTSDTEVDELPESGDRVTDEVESSTIEAQELERPPEDMELGGQQEAQNILLRGISADPSEFLKRRFKFQKEKYFKDVKAPKEKW